MECNAYGQYKVNMAASGRTRREYLAFHFEFSCGNAPLGSISLTWFSMKVAFTVERFGRTSGKILSNEIIL